MTCLKWGVIRLARQLSTEYLSQKEEDMSSDPGTHAELDIVVCFFSTIPVVRSKVKMGKSRDPHRQARLVYTVVNCERPCFSQGRR